MITINVNIKDKHATAIGAPVIVCGNKDYAVQFTFDAEWNGYGTKTARFVYIQEGVVKYQDVVFEGDTAQIPVLDNVHEVMVGVFAGDLCTSTPARISCEPSIRCGTGAPDDPTPSQYDQIMALLNAGGGGGGGSNQLLVTLSEDMTTASHSATEIMEHVTSGGEAVLDFMGMARLPYVMYLDDEAVGGVMFSVVAYTGKASMIAIIVRDDKSILPLDAMFVTPEDIDSVIPTALPNPKELLINGTRYDGSRSVSVDTNQHLIVTTADMQTASHSASEIRSYVQQNFDVSLDCAGMFRLPYVADVDGQCVFTMTAGLGGEATVFTLRVDENKAVTMEQFMLGTLEQFEGLIPEKLPNPNALTINGTSYDGTQAVNLDISGGGGYSYAELVDDITVNEEGLTEIVLNLDLQQCNEARIYTYTPATNLGTNYLYNLTFRDGTYQQRLCDMSAFSNNTTCSAVHYRALTEEYGEVLCSTGMSGGDLNEFDKPGGWANMQASKAPRLIRSGLKIVSGNKNNFQFPVGMRIMTFAWKK